MATTAPPAESIASGPRDASGSKTHETRDSRGTFKHAKRAFRSTALMAVDEDAEAAWEDDHRRRSSSGDRGLPSRLAHLRGPSSTTPAASRAPPPARPTVQPTVRTASGKTLMGPWVGRFARADADLADAGGASSQLCDSDEEDFFIARSSSPIDVMDADPPTPESCARYTPRGAKRHSAAAFSFDAVDVDALTDVAFAGPDETPTDHAAVTRELMLEDAITGRAAGGAGADARARILPWSSPPGTGVKRDHAEPAPAFDTRRFARGSGGRGRREARSAPAATRRVGGARVSARTKARAPHAVARATKEKLASTRLEATGGEASRGLFGGGKNTAFGSRNNGARNTMGTRCLQPRGGGGLM